MEQVNSENPDASTFHMTTFDENQAPARRYLFFTKAVCKICLGRATHNERRYKNPLSWSGRTVAVSRGLEISGVNQIPNTLRLEHHDSITRSLRAKKLHAHRTGAIAGGTHSEPATLVRICFAPCTTGMLVFDLTRPALKLKERIRKREHGTGSFLFFNLQGIHRQRSCLLLAKILDMPPATK